MFIPTLLKGQVAIVTGGGTGIGRAAALALVADGWRVALADGEYFERTDPDVDAAVRRAGGVQRGCPLREEPLQGQPRRRFDQHLGAFDVRHPLYRLVARLSQMRRGSPDDTGVDSITTRWKHDALRRVVAEDLATAIDWFRARTGAERVGLLGLRLGATLASLAADARSDVYALGATLYTLLTGQEPPESVVLIGGALLPAPRALLARPGYTFTRYQGPIVTFDALTRAINLFIGLGDSTGVAVQRGEELIVADTAIRYNEESGRAVAT